MQALEWRDPGCSMCLGMNPDKVPDGSNASTSNQNFEDARLELRLTLRPGPWQQRRGCRTIRRRPSARRSSKEGFYGKLHLYRGTRLHER